MSTFATAAEARRWIEANASLPERTLREALDVMGVAAPGAADERAELHAAIAAFLDDPVSLSSSSHGTALGLLGKVVGR